MSSLPITPPVPPDVLAAFEKPVEAPPSVAADLTMLQRLVKADKSASVAAVLHVAVLQAAALGMHLSGKDVAILSSIVSLGLSYFVGLTIRSTKT